MSGFQGPFCDKQCFPGTYGPDCQHDCSRHCFDGDICDAMDGSCPRGCKTGFKPPLCHDLCDIGMFGVDCRYKCGECKDGAVCRNTDGACLQGCSNTTLKLPQCVCAEGLFVDPEALVCTELCGNCRYGICQYDGECPYGCVGDFDPPLCKCTKGKFGAHCDLDCPQCEGGCHYSTGHCLHSCKQGFYPFPYCNQPCENLYFGENCQQLCGFCANNTMCSAIDGSCPAGLCHHGYVPPRCRCVQGYWGVNCQETCGHCMAGYCQDDGWCMPDEAGVIQCREGYKPPYCVCPLNTWGNQCQETCGYCREAESCSDINGTCITGCQPNYRPPECKEIMCPTGYYGKDCSKTCGKCMGAVPCDQNTGFCPDKCELGMQPPFCKNYCVPGYYGYSCLNKCGQCKGNLACDPVTGHCPGQCEPGFLMPKCLKPCHAFSYGKNCSNRCGFCAGNQPCNTTSGNCTGGCKGHHKPPLCSSCAHGHYGAACIGNCSVNCKFPGECNSVSGACKDGCHPGYIPPLCVQQYQDGEEPQSDKETSADVINYKTTKCFPGTYGTSGVICTKVCGHCKDNAPCSDQGRCRDCEPGFKLPLCQECEPGHYGFNCEHICGHCAGNLPCNSVGGVCEDGCEDFEMQTSVCKTINDLNMEVCSYRYFPTNCSKTCVDKMHGTECDRSCGYCQDLDKCGVVDGICYSGCESGYTGLQCHDKVSSEELIQNERGKMIVRQYLMEMVGSDAYVAIPTTAHIAVTSILALFTYSPQLLFYSH